MPAPRKPRPAEWDQGPLVFISYSHKDDEARRKLDTHMAQLKREGVQVWFDGDMLPGEKLDPAIRRKLKSADIFVALASPDYLHSSYCYDKEYGYAMRKAARKKVHVIVALLRACQWRHTRMARYKLLPKDGKPVDQWARRGDAYEEIVEGIRAVLKEIGRERAAGAADASASRSSKPKAAPRKLPSSKKPVDPGKPAPARATQQAAARKAAGPKAQRAPSPTAKAGGKRRATVARRPATRPRRPSGS